ncbi:hypothetical protein [Maritimibacter alkaliphilus]|uniref:hypothetical protein n=1 Tax=Maritimibacter alkaliphilus TaxID=404236 RepID=UPI001C96FED1|nr:hypothetical protein [Maritimibacter alkaliphilus]MBY6089076.1 hypothetical protein [Maritimibacter alkaliphilus]
MAKDTAGRVTLDLVGHFRVTGPDGADCTPVSQKAQAVLALLATGGGLRRTRAWLQDKLWSESDREQGAANLRQALATIRRALGPHRDLLQANRVSVWLAAAQVELCPAPAHWRGAAFLEGLDVPDSEFNLWLQGRRGEEGATPAAAAPPTPPQGWHVALLGWDGATAEAFHLQSEFLAILTRNLSEYGEVRIGYDAPEVPDAHTLVVEVRAAQAGGDAGISFRATARRALSGHVLWTETARVGGGSDFLSSDSQLLGLAFRVQSALVQAIERDAGRENTGFLLGPVIAGVFSFRPDRVKQARAVLESHEVPDLAGTIMGWRAQTSIIELIERFEPDEQLCVEQGLEYAARAVEADTMNSMVLSAAANANVLLGWNAEAGSELASMSIRVNPSNPLSWIAYAIAALYADKPRMAKEAAQTAAKLAQRTHLYFWCEFHVGLSALQLNELDEACRSFETVAALAPEFRPPLRYLLAAYASRRDYERAGRVLARLRALEPDFTLEAFVSDREYPVTLARRLGLLEPEAFAPMLRA